MALRGLKYITVHHSLGYCRSKDEYGKIINIEYSWEVVINYRGRVWGHEYGAGGGGDNNYLMG
jgi:hypothetical protein